MATPLKHLHPWFLEIIHSWAFFSLLLDLKSVHEEDNNDDDKGDDFAADFPDPTLIVQNQLENLHSEK